jgi:hydrogenase maturation protease
MKPSALLIGIGNSLRCDDGAGPAVVRRLLGKLPETVAAIEHHGEGLSLIQLWREVDTVVLIDAAFSGALPGIVYRFDAAETELPRRLFAYSSHLFGVSEAVEMARSLGLLPNRLVVYGIEGSTFAYGAGLSPPVARAVEEVADRVLAEIADSQRLD